MKNVLKPHQEQDGFRYIRVVSGPTPCGGVRHRLQGSVSCSSPVCNGASRTFSAWSYYSDTEPHHRVISSRRTEEAVETADFLKLCAEEGLCAMQQGQSRRWLVWLPMGDPHGAGDTLREAYYRYHAEVDQ